MTRSWCGRREQGGFGLDAQWADDVHHTHPHDADRRANGYYQDFKGIATIAGRLSRAVLLRAPLRTASRPHARALAGRRAEAALHGRVAEPRPDGQSAESASGSPSLVDPARLRLAAALVLLSPYIPLLFMGEEYGETAPFLYFIDHGDPALIEAVREGRKREFEASARLEEQIDPQAEETFLALQARLVEARNGPGAQLLSLYRDLLALRREEPALKPGASEQLVQGAARLVHRGARTCHRATTSTTTRARAARCCSPSTCPHDA